MIAARKAIIGGNGKFEVVWSRSEALGTASTTIVVNNDSGARAGDLLIIVVGAGSAAHTTTAPDASWNEVVDYGTGAPGLAVYWKIATASEPASYTFTLSGSRSQRVLSFIRLSNAVFDVAGTVYATTSPTADNGGARITAAKGILFGVFRNATGSAAYSTGWPLPTGTTSTTSATGNGAIFVFQLPIEAGDTGNWSQTPNPTGGAQSSVLFSVKAK